MHTYPLSRYMRFIRAADWQGVADLMVSSAEKVRQAGAGFVICPDNTIHQAFDLVALRSGVPWLHIAEEVASVAIKSHFRAVGILGTQFLMEGPVYPGKFAALNMRTEIPSAAERRRINEIIFEELVYGKFESGSRQYFSGIISSLKERGCDSVVLGCTEIPLLVSREDSVLPILDSTRILARAALARAVEPVLAQEC
jgi:aspartate racemase